jgi:hypothetical protein
MGFTVSQLERSMAAEKHLEAECAQVFGEDLARAEAQRIMARSEKRMFEDMMIVRSMIPELRRSGVLPPAEPVKELSGSKTESGSAA